MNLLRATLSDFLIRIASTDALLSQEIHMTLTFTNRPTNTTSHPGAPQASQPKASHSKALPTSTIDLNGPGRLRAGHLMTLFSISHSTLYNRINAGRIPKPDGTDGGESGGRPFWNASTIKAALAI
jgi:predicted DNA-binding transcriptional regulator AlpA